LDEAEAEYRQALDIIESAGSPGEVALVLNNLASLYRQQGKYRAAVPLFARAADLFRSTGNLQLANSLNNRALLHLELGEYAQAESLLQEAIQIARGSPEMRELLPKAVGNLGRLYQHMKRYAEAEALQREALDHHERIYGSAHPSSVHWM